jgi:hypothetical protein
MHWPRYAQFAVVLCECFALPDSLMIVVLDCMACMMLQPMSEYLLLEGSPVSAGGGCAAMEPNPGPPVSVLCPIGCLLQPDPLVWRVCATFSHQVLLLLCLPLAAVQVVGVAAGDGTCYCLTDAGEVFAWGQGSKGQLGTGKGSMLPHYLWPCNIRTLPLQMSVADAACCHTTHGLAAPEHCH